MNALNFIIGNLILASAYLLYTLFLERSTSFKLNRTYLLSMPIIAFLIPFAGTGLGEVISFSTLPVVNIGLQGDMFTPASAPVKPISILFFLGIAVSFLLFILNIMALLKNNKGFDTFRFKGKKVLMTSAGSGSYSFWQTIYLHKNDLVRKKWVLMHEYAHISQFHSIDIIIMQVYKAILWFNPAIYLWEQRMRENHEYLADNTVNRKVGKAKEYANAILESAIPGFSLRLGSSFKHKSILYKRIQLLNLKPNAMRSLSYLMVIPFIVTMLYFTACSQESPDPLSENSEDIILQPDVYAQYPGGEGAMFAFLLENIKYPESAKAEGIQGKVFVGFTINKDGKIDEIELKKGVSKELDEEALRVVRSMPDWSPALKDGKAVRTSLVLPFSFQPDTAKEENKDQ